MSKLRLAWVSPLSDSTALESARYSLRVLPELATLCELECFVDDPDLECTTEANLEVPRYHYHRLFERSSARPFDVYVHHIENHVRCQFARLTSHVFPGVSVFHDIALNNLYYGLFRYTTAPTELNSLVDAEFGRQAPRIGDYHVRAWSYEIFNRRFAFGSEEWKRSTHPLVFYPAHASALNAAHQFSSLLLAPRPVLRISAGEPTAIPELLFTGQHCLADRVRSVLLAFARLSEQGNYRLRWLLSSSEAFRAAQHARQNFQREFPSYDLQDLQLELIEGDALELALERCSVFISMRTDPLLGWPPGLVDALQGGVPVVASSTQLDGLDFDIEEGVCVLPEGVGDDLYLESFLTQLLEARTSRKPRAASLWATPKSCAQRLFGYFEQVRFALQQEEQLRRSRIGSCAAARLSSSTAEPLLEVLLEELRGSMPPLASVAA